VAGGRRRHRRPRADREALKQHPRSIAVIIS
jgi:hypothetical protein